MTPQELRKRLTIPVIGSPLFIISNPDLVIAQCKAGMVGSFPSLNARPDRGARAVADPDQDRARRQEPAHPDRPAAPFAVNQIVHKSNYRLEQDMALCVKYKVPLVITSLGARTDVNDAVHSYGGIVMHDVINQRSRTRRSRRAPTA